MPENANVMFSLKIFSNCYFLNGRVVLCKAMNKFNYFVAKKYWVKMLLFGPSALALPAIFRTNNLACFGVSNERKACFVQYVLRLFTKRLRHIKLNKK